MKCINNGRDRLFPCDCMPINPCNICPPDPIPPPSEPNLILEGQPYPADLGFAAWDYDPRDINASLFSSSGALQFISFFIHCTETITNVTFGKTTSGAGPIAGQNFIGIYNQAANLIGSTADISNILIDPANRISAPLLAPLTLLPGKYYLGILLSGNPVPSFMGRQTTNPPLFSGLDGLNGILPGPFTTLPPVLLPPTSDFSFIPWFALS